MTIDLSPGGPFPDVELADHAGNPQDEAEVADSRIVGGGA